MLFANPVAGTIHTSAVYYPNVAGAWKRPSGNDDFALTQAWGPSAWGVPCSSLEPARTWPGGEGVKAGTYVHFHSGIDLGNTRCGASILAAAAGTVTAVSKDGYGALFIKIDHGTHDGHRFETGYWHEATQKVTKGQKVAAGQVIATVGSTGRSTACHLHFMVWKDGQIVNPWWRLRQNTSVDPDAPVASTPTATEAEMVLTKYLPLSTASVAKGFNIRTAPALDAKVIRLTSTTETWSLLGVVKGDAAATSTDWYVRVAGLAFEFVHSSGVSGVTPPAPATGVSDAELVAAVLSARQGQYDLDAGSIAITDPPATAKLANARPS